MHDPHTQNLSEISHLFLSGVRDMAQDGAPRPTRIPPPRQNVSIDMTAAEFAAAQSGQAIPEKDANQVGPVSVLLASHFDDRLHHQAKAYARHLAWITNQRVGIIELDASLFRLYTVEKALGSAADESAEPAFFEAHQLGEALAEMNWDIDRWLLLLPNPRLPEARALLRSVNNWTLLTTADHDGMVSAYRNLKSLHDGQRPSLSLAVLDADKSESERIHHKLTGVGAQFLNWPLSPTFTQVTPTPANIHAHAVLAWHPTHDKAQAASTHHWKITTDFLAKSKPAPAVEDTPALSEDEAAFVAAPAAGNPKSEIRNPKLEEADIPAPLPLIPQAEIPNPQSDPEVIDLPEGNPTNILPALLSQSNGQLIECPLRAPQCPEARLAVTRDRRIVLLAVARQGLPDLRAIGQAYRWLIENRPLICMAVPQLAIDPHQHPALRLIINHADLTADLLQPLLQSSSVTVQSYRTLRWGPKTGLLLEAA